jgi:outer membrane protein TolC
MIVSWTVLIVAASASGQDVSPTGPAFDAKRESVTISVDRDIGDHLTLARAIELALANNPRLAATHHRVDAARARLDGARAERLPWVGLAGSYAHHIDAQRLLPPSQAGEPTMSSRDIGAAGVILQIPLFTSGRLMERIGAAELLAVAE